MKTPVLEVHLGMTNAILPDDEAEPRKPSQTRLEREYTLFLDYDGITLQDVINDLDAIHHELHARGFGGLGHPYIIKTRAKADHYWVVDPVLYPAHVWLIALALSNCDPNYRKIGIQYKRNTLGLTQKTTRNGDKELTLVYHVDYTSQSLRTHASATHLKLIEHAHNTRPPTGGLIFLQKQVEAVAYAAPKRSITGEIVCRVK